MSLIRGREITLNGIRYTQIEALGSGAVTDVYAANLDGRRVVIKLLSERWRIGGEETLQCQREGEVLRVLNREEDADYADATNALARARRAAETAAHRNIVAWLDDGLDDAGRPFIIQELAPGKVEVRPVVLLDDEGRVLKIMSRVAQAMTLAHKCNFALRDFEPRTKLDRIRVREDGEGRVQEVRLIDWNITGGPELFAQDLFYFGGHLHYLLLGRHLDGESDGRPPHTLGLGMVAWNNITEGSRSILSRLLNREPSRRYQTAAELATDLAWMERTVELGLFATTADRLRDRAFEARGQDRYDRLLAVADLALRRLAPSDPTRSTFDTLRAQARDELDKDLWQPLAMARVSLLAKQYSQAVANFDREMDRLDRRSEPARLARYLRLQAQVGQALRTQGVADPSQAREWAVLNQGVQALVQRTWAAAGGEFERAIGMRPDFDKMRPFTSLQGIAAAGQLLENASRLQAQAQAREEDVKRDDWLAVETQQIGYLTEAQGMLDNAVKTAPEEPFLADALESCKRELDVRQGPLPLLRSAEEALSQRRYRDAETALQKVLAAAPGQPRARHLLDVAQRHARFAELCQAAASALDAGRYDDAIAQFDDANRLIPGDPTVIEDRRAATAGLELLQKVESRIAQTAQTLPPGQAEEVVDLPRTTALVQAARENLKAVAGWQNQLIGRLLTTQPSLLAFGPVTGEHRLVFVSLTIARLRSAEEEVAAYVARQAQGAFERVKELWNGLRFEEALDLVRQIGDLDGALQPQVADWTKRLQSCMTAGERLAQKSASLRQLWSGGAANGEAALSTVRDLLAETTLDALPLAVTAKVRELSQVAQLFPALDFAATPDQAFELPGAEQKGWPPLEIARGLVPILCRSILGAQATAAWEAQPQRLGPTINLLLNCERIFGSLDAEQAALLKAAQTAQRSADQATEAARQGQTAARGHASAAESDIRLGYFDAARRGLQEALDSLAGDASETARRMRDEIQQLWGKLIETELQVAERELAQPGGGRLESKRAFDKLKEARNDLTEGAAGDAAAALGDRIVEGWRGLVRAQREPAEALRYLQEAVNEIAWCGQPEALNEERVLLQGTALPVGDQVAARTDWLAPAAQGGDAIRTANKALAVLADRLLPAKGLLAPERAWPALRAWALTQQDAVKASLHEILDGWDARAELARQKQQYAEVLDLTRQGEALVADTGWAELLADDLGALRRTAGMARKAALAAVERDLTDAEQAWAGLDFAAARAAVGQARRRTDAVKDLLTDDLRVKLDGWDTRLEGCIGAEKALGAALIAQAALAETATRDSVLRAFAPALAQAAAADLPARPRADARGLCDAVAALIEAPDQPVALPAFGEDAWPLLRETRATIHRIVVADLLRRLDAVRAAGQHETVTNLLTALSRLETLTAEQTGWLADAAKMLDVVRLDAERRERARTSLQEAKNALARQEYEQAKSQLEGLFEALPQADISAAAQDLRRQGAESRRQLIWAQRDPAVALQYAEAGKTALQPVGLDPELADAAALLQKAQNVGAYVKQLLELPTGEAMPPAAVGEVIPWEGAKELLGKLDPLLAALDGAQSWDALRSYARGRQAVVAGRVASWLALALERAKTAQETDYAAALAAADAGLNLAPQPRWHEGLTDALAGGPAVTVAKLVSDLTQIRANATLWKPARDAFDKFRRIQEARPEGLVWPEIAGDLKKIPAEGRDEYVTCCLGHLEALRAADELCGHTPGPGSRWNYAQILDQLFKLTLPDAETVTADWPWLGAQAETYRKVRERTAELLAHLTNELARNAKAFIESPNLLPEHLTSYCWQARWVLAALGDPKYCSRNDFLVQERSSAADHIILKKAFDSATAKLPQAMKQGGLGQTLQRVIQTGLTLSDRQKAAVAASAIVEQLSAWSKQCRERPVWVTLPSAPQADQHPLDLPATENWLTELQDALRDLVTLDQKTSARERSDAFMRAKRKIDSFVGVGGFRSSPEIVT